jgi:hypothetical protein
MKESPTQITDLNMRLLVEMIKMTINKKMPQPIMASPHPTISL